MNIIKTAVFAILFSAGISMSAQNIINSNEAQVTITGQTTREDLAQLRMELNAQGFDFRYAPNFDPQKSLAGLSLTIKANDGQLVGTGENKTLQNPNASISFQINKSANTCNVVVLGDLSH